MRYRNNLSGAAAFRSFIPQPLQEVCIEPDKELDTLISEADSALSGLRARECTTEQIRLLEREEAKSSWQLSSGKNDNPFSFCFSGATFSEEDRREIDDIVAATNYGIEVMEQLPLSTRLFKQIHYLVARSPRYEKKYPGEYRTSPVWIGRVGSDLRTAQFVAPVEEDMIPAITALENYINYDNSAHPLVQAALIHYQFEAIHPFIDCNGRVGRILNTLFLIERGILEHPVLPISESLKRVAAQYYMLLQEVSDTGNYDMWVKFFLRMVTDSASTSNRILTDE